MSDGPRDSDVWWRAKRKVAALEVTTLDDLQHAAHAIAVEKGWWDRERNIGEVLALIHSEISEALEEYRNCGSDDEITRIRWQPVPIVRITASDRLFPAGISKPEGFFVELVDAVIRIADLFDRYGVSLREVLNAKMLYNMTRPYRHGGKQA